MKSGPQVLKFVSLKSKPGRNSIYDTLRFRAISQKNESIDFQFLVPIGNSGGSLINELRKLVNEKNWVLVDLIEQNGMLCIKSIKYLPYPKEEFKI
jgi:hypothetical protein